MKSTERLYSQKELLLQIVNNGENMYGYFIRERQGVFSKMMTEKYHIPAVIDNLPDWMAENGNVAPGSTEAWRDFFAAIERGEKSGSIRVSLKSETGQFKRFLLRFNGISNEEGDIFFAIISIEDVNYTYEQLRFQEHEINGLLQALQKLFPEILTINLTQGTYRIIQYYGATTLGTPKEGRLEDMLRIRVAGVVPEDREDFAASFSPERMRKYFIQEEVEPLHLVYRRPGRNGKVYWVDTMVMRQRNTHDEDIHLIAVSRDVDAQKAEETRLREQLRQQTEELRLTMSQMGKLINYYDVESSTLTMPSGEEGKRGFPGVITDFPEKFIANPPVGFSGKALETIRDFYNAVRRGDANGSCEYHILGGEGQEIWTRLEFATIFDQENRPVRAVVAAEDITDKHFQATEANRLKKNERILQLLSRHSERVVLYYDLESQTIRMWDDTERAEYSPEQSIYNWLDGDSILPDSKEAAYYMFQEIQNGVPFGEKKLHIKNKRGERRWLDQKYSTLYDDENKPVAALISFRDITDIYEYELAYRRYIQSVEADNKNLLFIECDLTADRVERVDGQLFSGDQLKAECSHSELSPKILERVFQYENQEEASRYFSRENLLWLHAQGENNVQSHWKVRFPDDSMHWLDTRITLMTDPYTDHVRVFLSMADITEEKEKQLAIQYRSERDGMTGLLNRATAEKRIRSAIDKKKNPGILVLLDLDDLKGINDTYGHDAGDQAIRGIAEMLKSHFRESDIIGRIGGDEFIVYLSGAADSSESIAVSITTLLRKLAGISVGEDNERRIHCSVGCAVQTPEADTFEVLFKRADQALYRIKRSGKNNFAFYSKDLDQKIRKRKLLSLQNARTFEMDDLQYLLSAISSFYLLMMSSNLSTNDYFLLESSDGAFAPIPVFGELDSVISKGRDRIHPDDLHIVEKKLSRQALLDLYTNGAKDERQYIRLRNEEEYQWVEITVIFYTNEQGDVCDFVLLRWAKEKNLTD